MTIDKFSSVNCSRFCKLYRNQPVRLRRTCKPLRRVSKPLRRASKPLRRASKPLQREVKSLWRSNQSLRRSNQSLDRPSQSLQRTQNKPQEKNEYQQSTKPAANHNQSKNYKMSHCNCARSSIVTCINSDDSAHKCRLSVRQLTKQPHVKQSRDHEPCRLPLKRIVLALREKNRSSLKHIFFNSAPKSSFLNMIANDYKLCCFQFVHMQHIFIKSFAYFKPSVNCGSNGQSKAGNHQYKYTN